MLKSNQYFGLFWLILFLVFLPPVAHAGFWDFLFPSLREEYDPYETLQAPFAYDPNAPKATEEDFQRGLADNSPLDIRHRNTSIISSWVMKVVPQAISLNATNYNEGIAQLDEFLNATAKAQYLKFINETGLMKAVQSGAYDIRAFVEDTPELLNEGVVNGRYRWAFQVKMVTSIVDSNAKDYRNVVPDNRLITLTIQVGRTPDVDNEHGVIIERWEGTMENYE